MTRLDNLSRRAFLGGICAGGALVLGITFAPATVLARTERDRLRHGKLFRPNVFVALAPDGTVTIMASRSEMGTGIRTSLPLVLADEMDADWKRVKIEQAPGDPRYGSQDTDGSHSIRSFFDVMRECGAAARLMLLRAAAAQWQVPVAACGTVRHTVVEHATGRKLGYGELAAAAAQLPVPHRAELKLKRRSEWNYIGKPMPSFDLSSLCTGKPVYGIDVQVPGMLHASIERPPVLGGKVKSCDDREALQMPGVHQTVELPPFTPPCGFQALGGVAVIADNTWAAMQGRQKLKIVWENGSNARYDSDSYKKELQKSARSPARVVRNEGDVDRAFKSGKTLEAEYYVPLLAHASMEPPVAVAEFRDGKVTAWAPTQNPQAVQTSVARALGIAPENVTCYVTLLGGAFGRKSMADYVVEAALLAKATGRPVKVTWTREDDLKFDYYNTVAALYFKAAVGARGLPVAWLQRSAFPPIASIFDVAAVNGAAGELQQGWTDVPFAIPNFRAENGRAEAHVRIGWLRSVANIYNAFGVQTFADELAHAAGRDPLEYLLDLIGPARILDLGDIDYPNYGAAYADYPIDTGRLRRVLEVAAEKAGWAHRQTDNGVGWGLAVHRSFVTYVAAVVQVQVDRQGNLKIPQVDLAVDAGMVVDPQFVEAQFQGAAVFATSVARSGEITATNGVIDQSNFYDYPVARIDEAPYETRVHLVGKADAPPGGVGEPGVPPTVPALCNAVFAATGKRIRSLPLSGMNLAADIGEHT